MENTPGGISADVTWGTSMKREKKKEEIMKK
jgi:hypothetical protein